MITPTTMPVTVGKRPVSSSQLINGGFNGCQQNEALARQYLSGPQIGFVHYNGVPLIGGCIFDLLFNLAFPANAFFCVANNHTNDSLYISLKPTNRARTGSAPIVVFGNEEWFPMTAISGGVPTSLNFSFVRLNGLFNQIYLSHGTESGSGPQLTIAYLNDDVVNLQGGPWGP